MDPVLQPIVHQLVRLMERMIALEDQLYEIDHPIEAFLGRPAEKPSPLASAKRAALAAELADVKTKYAEACRRFEGLLDPVRRERWVAWRQKVDAVKAAAAIENVVRQYTDLNEGPDGLTGRCPLHEDKVSSLLVVPSSKTFRCSACGKRGDVFDFLRAVEGVSFPQAVETLRRHHNL